MNVVIFGLLFVRSYPIVEAYATTTKRLSFHNEKVAPTQPSLSDSLPRPRRLLTHLHESTTPALQFQDVRNNGKPFSPSWKDIFEIPIKCDTKEKFDSIPAGKRVAIVSRVSVLHLTLLSCVGPLIFRGAIRSSLPSHMAATIKMTPFLSFLFTLQGLSFHACHNLLNDWQDLDDDDSDAENSFRLSYGVHALKQGFMTKPQFLKLMGTVALPGIFLIILFFLQGSVLAQAAVYGVLALVFYTTVFKPIALGELLIFLVWGPLMAGYGNIAAGAIQMAASPRALLTSPVSVLFGCAALSVIMGKHTDKIRSSEKRTFPKVLGFPKALFACGGIILLPHIVLITTIIRERILTSPADGFVPTVPWGAALAFLTLLREVPICLRILRLGAPKDNEPTIPRGTILPGTILPVDVDRAWPLWFVAFLGWHALTFAYLMAVGSGMEWALRAILACRG